MGLFLGSLQQGLIYALLAMGVYLSFRVLNVPDLTADGSFTFGMAVSAVLTGLGHPLLGLLGALLAGGLAGAVTGFLQTKAKVAPILAGILTMSGLYTVNMAVQGGKPNVSLLGSGTLFSLFDALGLDKNVGRTVVPLLAAGLLLGLLTLFFHTHLGLCIRATGSNEAMLRSSSVDVDAMKLTALAISNGCVALSGGLLAQYQGFADVSSGVGTVVIGLASVIIGEAIFGRRSVGASLLSAAVGAILYRLVIAAALRWSVFPAYALKLVSAVIVALALSIPAIRAALALRRAKREARHA